ncbi:Thymidylate synthase [Actinomadura sp. RB99]|uniref:thymidylate synthase n=1 Tax=Actinomadura sp. RB99 TaxID=2691577 RepID=UPI001681CA49|nr:thymidylate synthase [Actinomadura sp. RB99]MBD2895619.1 Thymidylate synthase [Actinomadura sp. RB99]
MINVSADSATTLWLAAVDAVVRSGTPHAPRGLRTREIVDAHLSLTRPRRRLVCAPPTRVINAAFAAAETVWILAGVDDDWIYTYNQRLQQFADDHVLRGAYGPRLRSWASGVDQLDLVRRELLADPSTRRAAVQLWDPARDHQGHRDVPCTLGYWFSLCDGRLDMHTTMRSQDLWLGFCYDLYVNTVVHELVAGWVGAELGVYHHHIGSLHLYDEHLPYARDLATAAPPQADAHTDMAPLAVPWEDFDQLLQAVIHGRECGHPGWTEMAEVMRSYRIYKSGDTSDGRAHAQGIDGPLGRALTAWYAHLDRAAGLLHTTGRTRGTP